MLDQYIHHERAAGGGQPAAGIGQHLCRRWVVALALCIGGALEAVCNFAPLPCLLHVALQHLVNQLLNGRLNLIMSGRMRRAASDRM